jgi:hypothetical protein
MSNLDAVPASPKRDQLNTYQSSVAGHTLGPHEFRGTNLDLLLAAAIALGLPPLAAALYTLTGGIAASLVLYYGICCVGIVWWRRGSLGYSRPRRWPWGLLGLCLVVPVALAIVNAGTLPDAHAPLLGVSLTLAIWAPLNAALEQLSWFYVLDAWRTRWTGRVSRWVGLAVGILLLLILVGMIHVVFWTRFLPVAQPGPLSWLIIPLNFALTGAYAALYYRSGSMWPVFVVHLLADLQAVVLGHYSLLPYL